MTVETFLQTSYTAYHAVQNGVDMLTEHGFVPFALGDDTAEIGGKYYVVANDSTLIAFALGRNPVLSLALSHTDSPCLKVRGTVDSLQGKRLNVEVYGGLNLHSILDTPCRIAGRISYQIEGNVYSKVVQSDFTVVIPSLCVHHGGDKQELSVSRDMMPLLGKRDLYEAIAPDLDVLDADLYVVPDVEPFVNGADGEFLSSPRIDNLTSVYASLYALATAPAAGIAVCACFDSEETGSRTWQSAGGALLPTILEAAVKPYATSVPAAAFKGLALSIDNGHALHPAHPETADTAHPVVLNGGIVIKHNPNYATNAMSAGQVKQILRNAKLPYQDFYNQADTRCGSTLGLFCARQLLISTCDIGLGQLAMHSAVETVGKADIDTLQQAIKAFFEAVGR